MSSKAEVHSDELDLLKLSNQSLARYPEWVDELETETEMPVGYQAEGTLIIGIQPDDAYQLRHTYELQQNLGLNVEWLSGKEARKIESAISPYVTAAIRFHGACEAVPGIYELPLIETWTGLRPGSTDNAPILGKTLVENLIYATGHYRNGILLTPITAYEVSKLILTGETSETIAPFHLDRFSNAG